MPFAAVNRPGQPVHSGDLQRHHLLPRQAIDWPGLQRLFDCLGRERIGFDDFRRNGLLLPSRESAVLRLGLPLHLGPHRDYNQMVIERLGGIERSWARRRTCNADAARKSAAIRIGLLQAALRKRILEQRRPIRFHRADPLDHNRDFTILDSLAEDLWRASAG
ncbi:MAG: hypothetical protein EOP59_17270 [Sphingomonadales bacterium]|nr:MAG: hypothetical protein EOP59_17270 [Sphingomonadales bacterium]